MTKEMSAKAKRLHDYVMDALRRYDDEGIPADQQRISLTTQSIEEEVSRIETMIDNSEIKDAKGCKEGVNNLVSLSKAKEKISICSVVKKYARNIEDSRLEKVLGCNSKALLNLLKGDWCQKAYERLKIGQIHKTYFVFELYKWQTEDNKKKATVVGMPIKSDKVDEFEKLAKAESTPDKPVSVEDWKKKHVCHVLVDIYSDTIKYTKYSEATIVGIYYAQKTVNEKEVLTEIQKEFAYKNFLVTGKVQPKGDVNLLTGEVVEKEAKAC